MTQDADIHRHQCEVRQLLRWRFDPAKGVEAVRAHLDAPAVRGRRAALARDFTEQFGKRNTGKDGVWL